MNDSICKQGLLNGKEVITEWGSVTHQGLILPEYLVTLTLSMRIRCDVTQIWEFFVHLTSQYK